MLESKVESYLVRKVKELGGLCLKFVSPNCSGVPDRIVIYGGQVYFVELKAPKMKARELQKSMFAKFIEQGVPVYILNTIDQIDDFVGGIL